MNHKCSNCHSYKTRRKKPLLFFSVPLFIVGLFTLPISWRGQLTKPKELMIVLTFITGLYVLPHWFLYPEAFHKYKCKKCGFEFLDRPDEEKIEDKDLGTNRPSAEVIIKAEDLVKEGNRAGAVKLIKENTSLSVEEINEFMREEGLIRLLPKYPSDRVLRLAKFLLKRYDLPLPAITLIRKNTSLSLAEAVAFIKGLSVNDDNNEQIVS